MLLIDDFLPDLGGKVHKCGQHGCEGYKKEKKSARSVDKWKKIWYYRRVAFLYYFMEVYHAGI